MSNVSEESIRALQSLGFSELEAAIYTFLLQNPPTTGYRIAHQLNKPTANTYKGISALQARGAIIVDDSQSRLCRAVPPAELVGQMQRALRHRCDVAIKELAKLEAPPEDERIYRLSTWDQVIERTRQMLLRAQQAVLISAFPHPLEEIKRDLEDAANRGIGVLLKIYQPTEVKGADTVLSQEADFLMENLPGQELSLAVDAEEYLQASLTHEGNGVIQAIWSGSAFLSFNYYNGLYSEWLLTKLTAQMKHSPSQETLEATLLRSYPLMGTPGYRKLVQRSQALETQAT
jgi:sugar-specific transcriptional regulator TrmB